MRNDDNLRRGLLDELANALQPIALIATRMRRSATETADDAVTLEAAADRAVRALNKLREAETGGER